MGIVMKKTLFVSDLDGTLLRRDQTLSDFTRDTINALVDAGMTFTYATARSAETAEQVTRGLNTSAPRVLYNGAFVIDEKGKVMAARYFSQIDKLAVIGELIAAGSYPVVYATIGGVEKFTFLHEKMSDGCKRFLDTRKHCVRYNPTARESDLYDGQAFYILCIDAPQKLAVFYEKYKDKFNCIFSNDVYSGDMWLEIMPSEATKANALAELKRSLDCRLTVFGDGKNDADMFRIADESYAVENACEELRSIASAVIGKNSDDSVAKQLVKLFYR